MKKNAHWIICLVLLACCSLARADDLQLRIVDYGLYRIDNTREAPMPGVTNSHVKYSGEAILLKQTRTIPAVLGAKLGFRYDLIGKDPGRFIKLTVVMRYPNRGLHDPTSGTIHTQDTYDSPGLVGAKAQFTYYSFDHPWELVEGTWTRQLWYEGKLLAEEKFEVVKPVPAADNSSTTRR